MKLQAYKINAFAKNKTSGNLAGVVLNSDNLDENTMKYIAAKLALSETAFIMKSNHADFKIRFFTPTEEVDLCGHATIGSFSVLLQKGHLKPGNYTQETKAGILKVKVSEDHTIMMNQTLPKFYEIIESKEIAKSLNISENDLNTELPIQIVSTGLKDIIIPIKNLGILNAINPDFNKISKISEKYNAVGYHIFTLKSVDNGHANCRNLAPLYGIDEECATGTSNGALACYLHKYKKINSEDINQLVFEQGYSMGEPSEIIVSLKENNDEISEVRVGGRATDAIEIEVVI